MVDARQLVPMATLGIGTMAGLWFLGVPLAFTLALLTVAMLFIPYVGSVIAYIPAALVVFTCEDRRPEELHRPLALPELSLHSWPLILPATKGKMFETASIARHRAKLRDLRL